MKETEDVQRLVRLKRYETPGEEYFSNFADEFKDRQRSEMLKRSSRSLLMERVSMWFEETGPSKWAIPAGAAAAVGAMVLVNSSQLNENASIESTLSMPSNFDVDSSNQPLDSEVGESFQIALPKHDQETPPLSPSASDYGYGLLPVSASGSLREL